MPDMYNIGTSALLAYQRALTTTGHNISNVNTPGYSRQEVVFSPRPAEASGAGYLGTGVEVGDIRRRYDAFLTGTLRTQTSLGNRYDTYYNYAKQVDNFLADPNAGMAPVLEGFFAAAQGVADNPSSVPARQVMLDNAESMMQRFYSLDGRLNNLQESVRDKINNTVEEINSLAGSIANINRQISLGQAQYQGKTPNDLLDQRDLLLQQLSERINVSTVEQTDGSVNVFIGSGQGVVLGAKAERLGVMSNEYDPLSSDIFFATGVSAGSSITDLLSGGTLGGALQVQEEILRPAQNALGRLAIGLAETFNQQHVQGLDLNGQVGGNFFSATAALSADAVASSRYNTGTAAATITIDNLGQLTTNDYTLEFDGTNFMVYRQPDQSLIATVADPGGALTIDAADYAAAANYPGFTINIPDTTLAAAGDSYEIRPGRTAARTIAVELTGTSEIAAAAPLRSSVGTANLGKAAISKPATLDITDTNFFNAVTIDMRDTGTDGIADEYSTDGGTTWTAYTSGSNIDVNGWRVQITGQALDGDSFTVEKNLNAAGDNGNALSLAKIETEKFLIGGTATLQGAYANLISTVGTKTHVADMDATAQQAIVRQAQQAVAEVSGVNLDEEAANLMRYQQAYMAAAQMMQMVKEMFDSLLRVTG